MLIKNLIKKYRHIFGTDYTQDVNCQAAWLMDIVDEDPITDSSQNTNTGAAAGDPTHATADPPASYSTGYWNFDGVTDRFDVTNDASLDPGGDFSIVAWIRMTSFGDGSYGRIFDSQVNAIGNGYSFYVNNNPGGTPAGTKTLTLNIGNANQKADDSIIDTGTWYHVAVVFDDTANTATFYVNGIAKGNPASNLTPVASGVDATIGDRNDNARQFDGDIDELAFFDRTLDSTEINAIMDSGLKGVVSNPYPVDWLIKSKPTGYACFLNQYLKAKVLSYDPLKLPDGTLW